MSHSTNIFYTAGILYRPKGLKALTCLLGGGTEKRTVYKGFELKALNSNAPDPSHLAYSKYLEQEFFVSPTDNLYWAHIGVTNILPRTPDNKTDMGQYNVFPIDLSALDKTLGATNVGTYTHTPPLS